MSINKAPAMLTHPGAWTKEGSPLIEKSLARRVVERAPTPEQAWVRCPRCEGEECPQCDGSGFRKLKRCAKCGEAAGSISAGTGKPLVGGYHVMCRPGASIGVVDELLKRMGG